MSIIVQLTNWQAKFTLVQLSDHELKLIPIDSVNQPRCLNKLTQIISNCQSYVTDVTNGYVCSSCGNDFTVKTVSGTNKCLPDNVIDSQCTNYISNDSNYECS
jgi:transposase-like protein